MTRAERRAARILTASGIDADQATAEMPYLHELAAIYGCTLADAARAVVSARAANPSPAVDLMAVHRALRETDR